MMTQKARKKPIS